MNAAHIVNASRRDFLRGGAGLTLAVCLPGALAGDAGPGAAATAAPAADAFEPNAFVRIGTDDIVTVYAKHTEMGQGTYTGLATLVAEELDADWTRVRVAGAPADATRYNNLLWGPAQGTGGSTAIANSWEQLRQAGAGARAMLVAAAAQAWDVPAGEITARAGVLAHGPSGRQARYGELALVAAAQPLPARVTLKDPRDYVLIGKAVPRTDTREKITGAAIFTQDVKLPGLLTAVVAHPPRFGATLKTFDGARALAVKGVTDVVATADGVAVLARDFWSAKKGRDLLAIEWDESQAFALGSDAILAQYRELAATPGLPARRDGDVAAALAGAAKVIEADYEVPYLAHATMEPMNCVVRLTPGGCEVWNGEQLHTTDQKALAKLLGLEVGQVVIHQLYAGGSFGRRGNPNSDYLLEAARIAQAIGGRAPVKLVWTREDDTRAGYFRPLYLHRLRGALDAAGNVVAWQQRIVGQSILAGTPLAAMRIKDGIDHTSVEGAATLPYAIPNLAVELHSPQLPVPVQWWRSVGSTHTAFATEVFLDTLATAAGRDPVEFRLSLLAQHPRHAAVLRLAAEKAGWGSPLAPGAAGEQRGRGVALHKSFKSYVAQVVEVTVKPAGDFRVERVVCAVDCGVAVNPDVIRAQMEGGIGYGLSAALHGAITFREGRVEQSNFHDYVPLRIQEMPRVETWIVPSAEAPTGVGEPGTPLIAPALVNALHAATGRRITRLPLGGALTG